MADVFLGLFRTLFEKIAGRLIAQLSTGTTFFNYHLVDTDNTEHTGPNNLTSHGDSINPNESAMVKTTVWIHPTDGRAVSTGYFHGTQTPETPVSGPSTEIIIEEVAPFILVDGVYVARLGGGWYYDRWAGWRKDYGIWGGVHIQTISSVDYIVGYRLFEVSGGFKLTKYQTILDMNIDPATIVVMPAAAGKEIDYLEVDLRYPYDIEDMHGNLELGDALPMNNRILTCNADGSKTVFFGKRKDIDDSWYKIFPIFELTDTDLSFSIAEIDEFTNETYQYPNSGPSYITDRCPTFSETGSTCGWPNTNNDCGPDPSGGGYYDLPYDGGGSWDHGVWAIDYDSYSGSLVTSQKTFLGVSYDRKTDGVIIAHFEFEINNTIRNNNYQYAGGGLWTCSLNWPQLGDSFKFFVNGVQTAIGGGGFQEFTGQVDYAGGAYISTGTYLRKDFNTSTFRLGIIDLSCQVFCIFEGYNVEEGDGTPVNSGGSSHKLNTEKYTIGITTAYAYNDVIDVTTAESTRTTWSVGFSQPGPYGGGIACTSDGDGTPGSASCNFKYWPYIY